MTAWLADALTLGRLALAVGLVLVGTMATEVAQAIRQITLWLLLGWTADIADGVLARLTPKPTRWGRWDFPLDMAMVVGSILGLTAAGAISPTLSLGYLMVAAFLVWRFPTKATTMAVACPAVFAPFVLAHRWEPEIFWWSVLWAVAMLALNWRRFEEIVLDFVDTFPGGHLRPLGKAWRQRRTLRHPTSAS